MKNWLFSLILLISFLLPAFIVPTVSADGKVDIGGIVEPTEPSIVLKDMGSYYSVWTGVKTYHFGKNGLNEIWSYDDKVQMLKNEQFKVEANGVVIGYKGVDVTYQVISPSYYTITQTYDCNSDTQYVSVYTVKYGQPLTAECFVKSGAKQNYVVVWDFDGTSTYTGINNGLRYANGLNLRWDDVKATLGDVTTVRTTSKDAKTVVDAVAFNIGTVDAGVTKVLDPVAGGGNTYWVNGSGDWTDGANHWSDSSGGAANASYVPDSGSPVFFDANSSLGVPWTVTLDAAASCLDIEFTGAANSPTLTGAGALSIYGSLTYIAAMDISTYYAALVFCATDVGHTITTAGLQINNMQVIFNGAGGEWTLQDNYLANVANSILYQQNGTLVTNNKSVTCNTYETIAGTKALTLGSSIVNVVLWNNANPANLTVTANTAVLNVSGNFVGGSLDYNGATLNLTGATSTVSGNNSFSALNLDSTKTQTITFTSGTTNNFSTASLNGSAGYVHTLTGAGNWSIVDTDGGLTSASYVALTRSQASGGMFIADYNSTDGGNNSGWVFQKALTTTHTGTGSITTPAGDGTFIYNESTVATLVAVAGACYHFVDWTGDIGTVADPNSAITTITMDDNYSIVANFEITPYTLTVASADKGTVSTPAIGVTTYNCGTSVPIIAVPNAGYIFGGWTGDTGTIADATLADTTITIGGNYSITATFTATASYAFINTIGIILSLLVGLLVIFLLLGFVVNEVSHNRNSEGVKIAISGIILIVVIETIIIAFF